MIHGWLLYYSHAACTVDPPFVYAMHMHYVRHTLVPLAWVPSCLVRQAPYRPSLAQAPTLPASVNQLPYSFQHDMDTNVSNCMATARSSGIDEWCKRSIAPGSPCQPRLNVYWLGSFSMMVFLVPGCSQAQTPPMDEEHWNRG